MSTSENTESHLVDHTHDADAARLAALGYTYDKQFKREMSFWGNVSLGFTYLSPVVGIYTLFAASMTAGGPPMLWSLLIVGAGQLLVALVFGEIVSNYPVAGGVYPWSRRLWGKKWAWMNGWVYAVALLATIAAVAYGAGPFLSALLGFESSVGTTVISGLVVLAIATAINLAGTKALSTVAMVGLIAELGGALVVGVLLLVFARKNDLSVLFNTFGAGEGNHYFFAFAAAGLLGIFQYYGFEACGDVAEEISDPGRRIPKAMRLTIYIGGFAATFVCLSLILAVPDISAVINGTDVDPVGTTLLGAFGPLGYKLVLAVVLVSFVSCVMSLQAAASRLIYSMSRDKMLPGHRFLSQWNDRLDVPPFALLVAGAIPAIIIIGSIVSENALVAIVSFASLGIYLGFQMVVLAALRARLKGWKPSGPFTLGGWGIGVNILALVWGLIGIANIAWPRYPELPWFENWLTVLSAIVVLAFGLLYMALRRPYDNSPAPHGDAHRA
ncbi:APC family permease [Arthrobacter sp. MDB2-24]